GNVTSNGGGVILERGLCWSTSANPTISGNHIAIAGDTGRFTGTLTDLTSGTTYHVRAFATNAFGTSYGEEYTFTTAAQLSPLGVRLGNSCVLNNGNCQNYWMTGVVDANDNTEGLFVTNNGVTPGYNNGQASTVTTEILFQMPMLDSIHVEFDLSCGGEGCCDYLKAFLCLPSVTFEPGSNDYSSASYSGNNAFNFAAFLNQTGESYNPYKINLTQGNTVHIRLNVANPAPGGQAKLVFLWQNDNSVGNPPGAVITHLIVCDPADAPAVLTVSTSPVTEILDMSATCGGEVFYDDDAAVTARGVCWSTTHIPTIADSHTVDGTGTGVFTSQLTGLQPITQYFVRAYATGNGQTVYGEEMAFWTLNLITVPTVYTASVSNITATSATCGVQVGYNGGAPVTACGVCWSTSPNPTIADNHTVDGTADGNYTSQLTGLSSYTTYYVRAYATNVAGTGYGSEQVFTTLAIIPAGDGQPCPGVATVTDYDNNVYNTVKIGTQCWLKENLRSTHYTNGVVIPSYVAPMEDQSYVAEYGYLYNWAAVMRNANSSTTNPSGVQGICPDGWHVPSEAEWTQLTDYVASQPAYWCMSYNESHMAKALANSTGWNSSSVFCSPGRDMVDNNITGFSAMAAGEWVSNHCRDKGKVVYYWSTSMGNDDKAMTLGLSNNNADVNVGDFHVENKYAVRCVLAAGASTATVTTAAVSNVTAFTATCGGTVVSDGGDSVTARGVCWSTTTTPTIADNHTVDGAGTGVFTSQLTGLSPLTTYYVCAYATNAVGTSYGEVYSFTTTQNIELPVVLTQPVTDITETHAFGHGSVTSEGGAMVTERGVCWSISPNPTLADNHAANTNGGLGSYNVLMDNLTPGTTYHVRAYAINSAGVGYGEDETFTTVALPVLATVQTLSMSDITSETAVCHGEVVSDNSFEVTQRGFQWGYTPDLENNYSGGASAGSGVGSFSATMQNLNPNTTYYVMAYATNSAGTAYGEVISFTTNSPDPVLPSLITTALTDLSATTAICGGIVSDDGGAVITTRGLCWSTTANPTSSDNHVTVEGGVGSFTAQMSGLEPYTTYHVRAYATNSAGTAYGNELTFTTKAIKPAGDGQPCLGNATVTDVDGNVYNTVQIGNQCWMKENLRTTHFADGKMLTGPYYAPNNDTTKVADYGYLYHWADAMKGANGSATNPYGVQGICPNGWHLPSDAEWTQLTDYVSAQQFYLCTAFTQNTIAKSLAANTGWISHTVLCSVGNNLEENNATGFSVMPAGEAVNYVTRLFGQSAYFWSATANENGDAWNRSMQYHSYSVNRSASYTSNNNSVRCVLGNGADLAKVLTGGVSDLTDVTALINGEVTTDGGAPVTERGFCWGILTNPNLDDAAYNHVAVDGGVGEFVAQLSGLNQNQRYYYRTYVINTLGLTYGDVQQFTTNFTKPAGDGLPCEGHATVTDIDGNVYNTVKLGNQCWMKENLRTTRFADGKEISADIFTNYATIPSRYAPDNNAANVAQYGYLYNLSAATHGAGSTTANPSGVQGVCPDGWHLPSMAEWEQLNNYLGTYPVYMSNHSNTDYVGKALASTTDWQLNSVAYTVGNDLSKNNVAGFSAMPSGYTVFDMYHGFGQVTIFWTATHGTGSGEYSYPLIRYNLHHLSSTNGYEDRGYAVRCVLGAGQNAATVNTLSVGQITTTSATCGGNVTADGGAEVTARGVCWSLNSNPTIADNHTTDGTGTGSFTSEMTGLMSGHNYYVRAYATNSTGTTYGSEIMFTTPVSGSETPTLSTPVVTTAAVTNLKSSSATCGGTVTGDGGTPVNSRGICWSTSPNP
ncbi:MAG: fibrobacter succinogenes major paralogous domain-containing protein, partial [Bacteroidales bacterium]|nr:fibrobacter succinogenes major paralogous domain-containing protein [Bacteroidales bacterium]